jgi:hypothetical protein
MFKEMIYLLFSVVIHIILSGLKAFFFQILENLTQPN